jgi:hypothetical protein
MGKNLRMNASGLLVVRRRQQQRQPQIPSLRCGMTNKKTGNDNSRSLSGMTTRKTES